MNLITKLYIYLQNLSMPARFSRRQTGYSDGITVNTSTPRPIRVYTRNNRVYDWEREEAISRHPSNYRKGK
jgi:hypothetical protein